MNEVLIALLTFLGLALPAAVALSTPRRILSLARAEAETWTALPKDHPSRKVLFEEIKETIDHYHRYSEQGYSQLAEAVCKRLVGLPCCHCPSVCDLAVWARLADT